MSMPEGIETIKTSAFNTAGLEQELTIPSSIKTIENSAFSGSLINILNLSNNIEKIGNNAFLNVPITGSLELSNTITSIGDNAFTNTKITELKIKGDSTTYGYTPFKNISTLKKLEMPITLSGGIVYGTTELEELHLTKGSTGIGFNYNCGSSDPSTSCDPRCRPWYTSREYGGASATSIGEKPLKVTIGEGVKSIGQNTFYNSYRVQLQSSVEGITFGTNAFTNSGVDASLLDNSSFVSPISDNQELDYIISQRKQFINTNYNLWKNSNWKMELKFDVSSFYNYNNMFGSLDVTNTDNEMWIDGSGKYIVRLPNTGRQELYTMQTNIPYVVTLDNTGNSLVTIFDSSLGTFNFEKSKANTSFNYSLGFAHRGGGDYLSGKIYYLKFWSNGQLVRDFIPVKNTKRNLIGLYDKVGERFYKSSGSEEFIEGPIKE